MNRGRNLSTSITPGTPKMRPNTAAMAQTSDVKIAACEKLPIRELSGMPMNRAAPSTELAITDTIFAPNSRSLTGKPPPSFHQGPGSSCISALREKYSKATATCQLRYQYRAYWDSTLLYRPTNSSCTLGASPYPSLWLRLRIHRIHPEAPVGTQSPDPMHVLQAP
ncbi:unnamed protein product [Stenotrophomonas maltophilia]|nr:unnamed protein product [Stenotrophomonas maltophilia]